MPHALPRRRLALALAFALSASGAAHAQDSGHAHTRSLEAVNVTASPFDGTAESMAMPVAVLHGEALDDVKAATLGETVAKLPGVQTTYFGTGVGRPIIRGQDGPRVQMLNGGIGSVDASTVSADHAVAIEPFLADQIEVLKGPATLLFGSGAIGGAVNVVDGRLPDAIPDRPLSGRAELRGNLVNDERSGAFRLDGVSGNVVLHVDGLVRNTDDFDIPGVAALEHEEHAGEEHEDHDHEEQVRGTLPNSAIKTRAGAVGATWLGEEGYFGLALSTYRTNYGIPEGAHVHAEEEGHDHEHGEEEHAHEEEGPVRIDLTQNRIDMKAGIYNPLSFLRSVSVRAAHTDYEHVELEGGAVGTRFTNKGTEGRLEAVQQEWNGWNGAFGVQLGSTDFAAIGDEAFVPTTGTDTLGVFVLQNRQFGPFKLELGARWDRVELSPRGQDERSFDALNLSAAGIWKLGDGLDLRMGIDRSERAPTQEELFASGTHVATQSVEIGNAGMDTEKALRAELGLHWHSERLEASAAIYQTNFENFIYLADTGLESDGYPVRLWTQEDAIFRGAEAEAVLHLGDAAGAWDLRVFGDYVRAKLDGQGSALVGFDVPHGDHTHSEEALIARTGNLPRIAPLRYGADLRWSLDGWRASVGAVRYGKQDDVAQNEEESAGYTLVDAHLAYRWDRPQGAWELFLDGTNLTDREARPHTSLLRDYAPLPGRGVAFGIRAYF